MKAISGIEKGVFVISVTPFDDSGAIDWASIDSLVEFYLACGVNGVTILGMMGEAQKLGDSESAAFTKYFLDRIAGRVPVIVGVSQAGNQRLAALSNEAMAAGASGVMVAPVAGLKTEVQLRDYMGSVIKLLGPDIPICYQDYPQTTGVNVSVDTILRMVDDHPSFVMFKHEDWPGLKKLQQIRAACDGTKHRRLSILCGNGGMHLPQELQRGADGAMTGFAYPEMLVQVCDHFFAGKAEEAEDIFDAYLPLVRHEQQAGVGLALRKEVLRRRGVIAHAALRAPGPRLDRHDLEELERLIHRLEKRREYQRVAHWRKGVAA